jgi:hypothetical protein
MADSRQQIESRVRAFVAELEQLVRQAALEAVSAALGGGGSVRRGPGRPRGPVRPAAAPSSGGGRLPRAGGRRSQAQMDKFVETLASFVAANPGKRMEQIGAALGAETRVLSRPMSKLLSAGRVRREGQKRASKYFPGSGRGGAKRGRKK